MDLTTKKNRNVKGLTAGIGVGTIGAILGGLLVYFTNFEIGWMAWVIGAGVGATVAWGSDGSRKMGMVAVAISILSLLAGRYIPVEISLEKAAKIAKQDLAHQLKKDDYMISRLADEIFEQSQGQGHSVEYSFSFLDNTIDVKTEHSKELLQQAKDKWDSMTPAEKKVCRKRDRQQMVMTIDAFIGSMQRETFIRSFKGIEFVFFILGIVTAYYFAVNIKYFS